ncbi:MAG: phosphoribosylanthranilate isomerase [Methanosphaera sp.]|nr:phosphoribosylanthranilate isomerase [Methanosphaera sp.]
MTIEIKVCGITRQQDLKKIEKLGVDHIGFINIERSKRNISMDNIIDLQKNLLDKNKSTLVLEPNTSYEALMKVNRSQIFNLQLHSLTCFDIRYLLWLNQYHNNVRLQVTRAIGLRDEISQSKKREIEYHSLYTDNILFDYIKDGLTGGTNTQIPIDTAINATRIVKAKDSRTKVTLSGGLNLEYLESIKDKLDNFDMIDLNSGVEDEPGIKNIKKVKQVVKLLRE